MIDITPKNVTRMQDLLRGLYLHPFPEKMRKEAADVLEAVFARLTEVERHWEACEKTLQTFRTANRNNLDRAEATEAKLAASEAREAKLKAALYLADEDSNYVDLYQDLADARGAWLIARAIIEENKP
jgi:hypothetical protein